MLAYFLSIVQLDPVNKKVKIDVTRATDPKGDALEKNKQQNQFAEMVAKQTLTQMLRMDFNYIPWTAQLGRAIALGRHIDAMVTKAEQLHPSILEGAIFELMKQTHVEMKAKLAELEAIQMN